LVNNTFFFFEIWRKSTHYFHEIQASEANYFISKNKMTYQPQLQGVAHADNKNTSKQQARTTNPILFIFLKFDDKGKENIPQFYLS